MARTLLAWRPCPSSTAPSGRTGVAGQPAVPRRDDVRRLGQPRPRRVHPDHPRAPSTPASTSSTPPTSTRAGSPRRSSARRCKGRRDDVVLATKVHGTMGDDANRRGNSRRWIMRAVEDSPAPARHRLDRPLPGPPPRAGHRRRGDARRARPTSSTQGKVRYVGSSTFPAAPIVEAQWAARERGLRALRHRAAAVLAARARRRGRRPADLRPPRHGRDPLEPARGRLALGPLAHGPRRAGEHAAPSACPGASTSRSRPTQRKLEAVEALAALADEAGLTLIQLALAFVLQPPGGHRADHRPAHDGAPRVPARRRST